MNTTLIDKFLKSTHFLTISMVFMFAVYASLVELASPAFSKTPFKVGLCVVLIISILSLSSLFRKAFMQTKPFSYMLIGLSLVFYLNEYLRVIPNIATQISYMMILGFWSLYLSMQVLFFNMDKYNIEDRSIFPEYDCVAVNPFVEEYDFGENPRDPLEYEFDKFTIFYKNCYASDGIIYCDGEACKFFEALSYVKEERRNFDGLSKDDCKLISMINI